MRKLSLNGWLALLNLAIVWPLALTLLLLVDWRTCTGVFLALLANNIDQRLDRMRREAREMPPISGVH